MSYFSHPHHPWSPTEASFPPRSGAQDGSLRNRPRPALRSGFTLTELLVVVFIMTIMLGITGLSLANNNNSKNLDVAVNTLESLIYEASNMAKGKGTPVRLCINNDPGDEENFGRQILIAHQQVGSDPAVWLSSSRAVSLPTGIFVDDTYTVAGDIAGSLGAFENDGTGVVDFSRDNSPSNIYLEFNQSGVCAHPLPAGAAPGANPPPAGATIVLVNAVKTSGSNNLIAKQQDGQEQVTGLVVWRNGSTSRVNDPTSISK